MLTCREEYELAKDEENISDMQGSSASSLFPKKRPPASTKFGNWIPD